MNITLKTIKATIYILLITIVSGISPLYKALEYSRTRIPTATQPLSTTRSDSDVSLPLSPQQKIELLSRQKEAQKKLLLAKMATQKQFLEKENTFEGHPTPITHLAMGENGNIIVSSCEGTTNNLIVWDRKTKNKLREMSFDGNITDIFLSPDESKCVIAYDKTDNPDYTILSLFNTKNLDAPIILPTGTENCCLDSVEFSFDSKYIAYRLYSENIKNYDTYIFDIITNQAIKNFKSADIIPFAFHPKKAEIAIAFPDMIFTYNLNPVEINKSFTTASSNDSTILGDIDYLNNLFYSHDGNKIVFYNNNGENPRLLIWGDKGELLNPQAILNKNINYPKFTLDNKAESFIAPDYNQINPTIAFYNVNTNEIARAIPVSPFIYPLSLSPDNKFIIGNSVTFDSEEKRIENITAYEIDTGKKIFDVINTIEKNDMIVPVFKPNHSIKASGFYSENNFLDPFIALSKDSSRIAIGVLTYDNTGLKKYILSIYDLNTGTRLYHSSSNLLYTADKNFGTIIFKDEKNPKNFILKDLTKTTFNFFPRSKGAQPIARGPQSTPVKLLPRRITASSKTPPQQKQEPAPIPTPLLTRITPVQPTTEIKAPITEQQATTTPLAPSAPQKLWWQRWIGW